MRGRPCSRTQRAGLARRQERRPGLLARVLLPGLLGLSWAGCLACGDPPDETWTLDAQPRTAARLVGDERRAALSPRLPRRAVRIPLAGPATHVRLPAAAWSSSWLGTLRRPDGACELRLLPSGRTVPFRLERARSEARATWSVVEADADGADIEALEVACRWLPADSELWIGLPEAGRGRSGGRNVMLISLDTVRIDDVGRADPAATPALDALAAGATSFTNAFAPAPWTLPSHVSVMTGLLPSWHGRWDAATPDHELPDLVTLAGVLGDEGYETAAFTGKGSISWMLGPTRDFRLVVEDEPTKDVSRRECDVSAGRAARWLRSRRTDSAPFLLFWHSYEAHWPYHDERFAGSAAPLPPGVDERARGEWLRHLGDLAAADAAVQILLDALAETGLDASTDVVVFSDHGEDFGEHSAGVLEDATRHGHGLWDTQLRVPLIIRSPALPPGRRDGMVSLVDIFPTVLELAGRRPPRSQGMSLLAGAARAAIAAESLYPGYVSHEQKAWREEGGLKHVATLATPPRDELFDAASDPLERTDLQAARPDDAARLRQDAAALWRQAPPETSVGIGHAPGREVPPELLESLRSLGYVR